jgi:hypothetical protein
MLQADEMERACLRGAPTGGAGEQVLQSFLNSEMGTERLKKLLGSPSQLNGTSRELQIALRVVMLFVAFFFVGGWITVHRADADAPRVWRKRATNKAYHPALRADGPPEGNRQDAKELDFRLGALARVLYHHDSACS